MTTIIEVTLKIAVNHSPDALDENSIKAFVNEGTSAMADFGELTTIGDEYAKSVSIAVSKLRINKQRQAVSLFGTADVPWGRD